MKPSRDQHRLAPQLQILTLGKTIAETYLIIRLNRAAELLRSTGLPVTEVALACGFRSATHFARRFAARSGMSASQFRVERK